MKASDEYSRGFCLDSFIVFRRFKIGKEKEKYY